VREILDRVLRRKGDAQAFSDAHENNATVLLTNNDFGAHPLRLNSRHLPRKTTPRHQADYP
jgi:hypothetical protein